MWRVVEAKKSGVKKKLEEYQELIKTDEVARNNALIRFFYSVKPEELTDDDWCKYTEEINFVLHKTGQTQELKNGG